MKKIVMVAGMFALTALAMPLEANAVVCAKGVVRAGCAGPNGAVVTHRRPVVKPVPVVHCAYVNGRRVCR